MMVDYIQNSVMLQNIWEQPKAVEDCLSIALPLSDAVLAASHITLLACGSSRHAALTAQHWLESLAQLPTKVLDASAWTNRPPLLDPNTVIIALSQSGKTKDLLESIAQIKAIYPEVQILAIANVPDSPLAQLANLTIITPAGPEGAVAATKSFTAQLAILARMTLSFAESRFTLAPTQVMALESDLDLLPSTMTQTLEYLKAQALGEALGLDWMKADSLVLLGRGLQQPIALEGALKLKETCYVHAEGFEAGDFCHGPMAILKPGFPIIALRPNEKMRSELDRFRSFGSYVIGIGRRDDRHLSGLDEVLEVETIDNWLTPFLTVLPLQLLAYDWARSKGLNVDQPRYLTKFIG
jgi:glucosamine 6-phosphate synthetase-like amidotransferase/phosphosugar isomerase protein